MRGIAIFGLLATARGLGFCNDKDRSCAAWAKDGECDGDNKARVLELCPHTCGVCGLVCNDKHDDCGNWAKSGECTASPEYMSRECPTSCGFCSPKCADINEDCHSWGKEGQCESNPGFMNLH
jgi:hypothetical protein